MDDFGEPQGEGNCFPAALNYAWELTLNPEKWMAPQILAEYADHEQVAVRVCHGKPIATGGPLKGQRYWHAWVEVNPPLRRAEEWEVLAFDRSTGKLFGTTQEHYYRVGTLSDGWVLRYPTMEALERATDAGHYGPWDTVPEEADGV